MQGSSFGMAAPAPFKSVYIVVYANKLNIWEISQYHFKKGKHSHFQIQAN